ncbi:hypothetical protein RI367_007241 [Sorochytrium milnesiophthora]
MFLRRLVQRYNFLLEAHPYRTQALTAGTLWFAGDMLSQAIERRQHRKELAAAAAGMSNESVAHEDRPWDLKRAGTMSLFGFVVAGPLYSWWYSKLDKVVGNYFARQKKLPGYVWTPRQMAVKVTAAKLVADMFLFDPPYLTFFFASTSAASGMPGAEIVRKLKQDVLPTYVVDLAVWAPIQTLNFSLVRVAWQPVVVNSVNVFWNAYLSYVKHQPVQETGKATATTTRKADGARTTAAFHGRPAAVATASSPLESAPQQRKH